jgi:hypothetical protein
MKTFMNRLYQTEPAIFWYLLCSVTFSFFFIYLIITLAFRAVAVTEKSPRAFNQCCYYLYSPLKAVKLDNYICVDIELRSTRGLAEQTVICNPITAHEQALIKPSL